MALVKQVSVRITAEGVEDAELKIGRVRAAAKELADANPKIKPEIDATRALVEARLLRDGIKRELAGALDINEGPGFASFLKNSIGGGLSSLLTGAGGGIGAIPGLGGLGSAAESNPYVAAASLAAVASAASAVLVEVTGLVSGFAAAGAGAGAFALLALPAFDKVKNAYTAISTAQDAYNKAAEKEKLDPTKANKNAAATALLNLKVAQDQAGPGTLKIIDGIHALTGEFGRLSAAFQPTVLKVFTDALKVASDLLPVITPMARAFGGALDGLLKKFDGFANSKGFKDWLGQFDKLIGPSVTAIGTGIGKVAAAVGDLFTRMSSKDVVHAINIAFDTITGILNALGWTVQTLMLNWDKFSAAVTTAWTVVVTDTLQSAKMIIDAAAKAFGWIPGLGPTLKGAAASFDTWASGVINDLHNVSGAAQGTIGVLALLGAATANALNAGPGPGAGKITQLSQHAAGGITGPGWSLVGENGPELVRLPGGSTVYPAGQTRQMAGSGGTVTVRFEGADREFATFLNRIVRTGVWTP